MQQVFSIPESMKKDFRYTFCPGCDHGIAIRLVAEVIDELGIRENIISSTSVGCSVFLYDFLNIDCVEAPHGRALASATGVKRARPDKFVFTYSGDGDFASIGIAESLHSALRGENISAICINNTTYGMTGGQLGPTTMMGQITTCGRACICISPAPSTRPPPRCALPVWRVPTPWACPPPPR